MRIMSGASEQAIEMVSNFLSGAHVWGCDTNKVIYARVSDDSMLPVAVDRGTEGIRIMIEECQMALDYHLSISK